MHRTLGAILLIIGTCVGAGILALPIIASSSGFFPGVLTLFICWAFLFFSAILLLEVNLASPDHSNLISMAGKTLGPIAQAATWILTFLLLYSLLTAYIAGSAPFFSAYLPHFATPLPIIVLFAIFVYLGTAQSDRLNRLLITAKALAFLMLIILLPSHVELKLLTHVNMKAIFFAFPITITAFGFHTIIPVLTPYLNYNRKKLYFAIFFGSLIPLCLYILWDFLILGTLPMADLALAREQGTTVAPPLVSFLKHRWVSLAAGIFPFVSILTSFLGVSLSLSDFVADGLRLRKFSLWKEIAALLTFIPPFIFFLINPNLFISALSYGGVLVALLLGALPAMMAWTLPHLRKWRPAMALLILFSFGIVILDILQETGILSISGI